MKEISDLPIKLPVNAESVFKNMLQKELDEQHCPYELKARIGNGSFGHVWKALKKFDNGPSCSDEVALKFIELRNRGGNQSLNSFQRELLNHWRLFCATSRPHPAIVEFQVAYVTSSYLILVMELASRGNVRQLISKCKGKVNEDIARIIMLQVFSALDFCHSLNVAHRDIKPDNILVVNWTSQASELKIKISDFGFSKDAGVQSGPKTKIGTPFYVAPEIIDLEDTNENHENPVRYDGCKADCWSCGILLYFMATGNQPFWDSNKTFVKNRDWNELTRRIRQGSFPDSPHLSDNCKDLIQKLLTVDPKERISAGEALLHPWCCQDNVEWFTMPDGNRKIIQWHQYSNLLKEVYPQTDGERCYMQRWEEWVRDHLAPRLEEAVQQANNPEMMMMSTSDYAMYTDPIINGNVNVNAFGLY